MRRFILFLLALVSAAGITAQEKLSFIIMGPEETYNQIRVVNETSLDKLSLRVVLLDRDNTILSVYGDYSLNGFGDVDSNTAFVNRGVRLGIQFPKDFKTPLSYDLEYKDYPLYDAIIIHLVDGGHEFGTEF